MRVIAAAWGPPHGSWNDTVFEASDLETAWLRHAGTPTVLIDRTHGDSASVNASVY